MRPLLAVWPYAAVFWLTFAGCYSPEVRLNWQARSLVRLQRGASAEAGSNQDSGSFWTIWAIQIPAFSAAFVIAFLGRLGVLSQRQLWFWTGLATMIAGNLLRRHCFRMLGSSFTAVVVVKSDQTVIERGAYRWVRHPSYTAAALFLIGIAVALGNWISVLLAVVAVALSYCYRVSVEERALIATLGDPYRNYMRRTKRFIPMVV